MAVSLATPLLAYVLNRYDWSESSVILDVFTREQGRLVLVAKGAKRPYSQLRSVLLPFQLIELSVGRAPREDQAPPAGEVRVLRAAQWAGAGGPALLHGPVLFSAFYLNELLIKLLARQDPYPVAFDAYVATLAALMVAAQDVLAQEAALRAFELTLLRQLGVLPDLGLVTLTQCAVQTECHYHLLPEGGVASASATQGVITGQVLTALQLALQCGSLGDLQKICLQTLPALRPCMRHFLAHHLGGSALLTRRVIQGVHALGVYS